MNAVYYNEVDPHAAQWLRNLMADGLIPAGDVDERDIRDVLPSDLDQYRQCHFFAGVGGWPLALRWAGWPSDRPIWTGSCPCQPFSQAGRRCGFADERHLWPAWAWLISQSRPDVVAGEQVDGRAARLWLDAVSIDLERAGYAVGAAVLPAAGVGAPHARHRNFWMAHCDGARRQPRAAAATAMGYRTPVRPSRGAGGMADQQGDRQHRRPRVAVGDRRPERCGPAGHSPRSAGQNYSGWDRADWIKCRDALWRPVEPGTQPLADGVPGRLGLLRGYGNAIVPQVAAAFLQAAMTVIDDAR